MKLYVLRHGQTILNLYNLINGRNVIGINKVGKAQALKAAKEVANIPIDLIFCSPLRRTKQTCKIVNSKKIKVIYDKRLMERDAKSKQFTPDKKLDLDEWYDINKDIVYKNSEGFKSIYDRVKEFLEELRLKYPDKSIMLVTHGDVCKAINAFFNSLIEPEVINLFEQDNCEIKTYNMN